MILSEFTDRPPGKNHQTERIEITIKTQPKKHLVAWLLALAMLLSLLPTAAFAGEAAEETAVETLSEEGYRLNEDAATSGT